MRATCSAYIILIDLIALIISGEAYSYEALHYALFSSFLPILLSEVQIFFSAPSPQIPTACVLFV
jgi:hypothetical protein